MNISEKLKLLMHNGITVYPNVSSKNKKFAVQVNDEYNVVYKKTLTTGVYKHTTDTINKALEQTINHIVQKITKFK